MAGLGTTALDGVFATISGSGRTTFDLRRLHRNVAQWERRRGFRADLRRLLKVGPHMIADIGLTLEEALDESAKPFWRP